MERVLDDGRKINQVLVRGKYGTQAERYWSVLRANINDLARCYNLTPLESDRAAAKPDDGAGRCRTSR